ncbi:MAG: radical SAM protein [Candidatus Paceibacterota bacterium]
MNGNIMLVSPNTPGSYRSANVNDENLALGYLAAVLERHGYQVEIIDARMSQLSPVSVAERIGEIQPFFLGISTISEESVPWIDALGKLLNSPSYLRHVCMGGYYPSLQPETVLQRLPFVNSVARGEGEFTVVDLVERIRLGKNWHEVENIAMRLDNGSVKINSHRPVIPNLDTLPFPKRYADKNSTEIVIEGSRGCFGRCTFCAVGPHFDASSRQIWRGRSPEHIVAEILQLRRIFPDNVRYRFIDPDFFGSASRVHSERTLKLASLIQEEVPEIELYVEARVTDIRRKDVLDALKKAGLKEIYLGIESGSEKILTHMGKNASVSDTVNATRLLEDLGINYQYGYMMVTPWTEYQDVLDSLALLRTIGRVQFDKLFNELYLIPGTVLVERVGGQCNLIREEGTGYYFYETNQFVKNIRAFGVAFETVHKTFAENLWFLYKDVQRHEQCHVEGAATIQRKLSDLFIAIFEFCLEKGTDKSLTESDVHGIVEEAIVRFQGKALAIKGILNPAIIFPRPT